MKKIQHLLKILYIQTKISSKAKSVEAILSSLVSQDNSFFFSIASKTRNRPEFQLFVLHSKIMSVRSKTNN